MKTTYFLTTLLLISILACRPSETETTDTSDTSEADGETPESKVGEITYYDLLTNVFEDDGYVVEYHEEVLPNDFIESLTITKEGLCGSGGCGEGLYITNSSATDTLEVVVTGVYDLDGNSGSIARQYVIPANGKVSIGCSHLCVEGASYGFERKIVGSKKFVEPAI